MSKHNTPGTALITGASAGIGAIYADRLARRGYDLILVARDLQRLDALAGRLRRDAGVKVETLQADLTVKSDLAKVEWRLRDDAAISLLLNNAGVATGGGFIGGDLDRAEALIALNILAVTRLAGAVLPGFVARKRGTLINLSSVLALAPEISGGPYSGSKAYVLAFTQSLQQEVAGSGVRLQAVLPGATRTEIWERAGMDLGKFPPEMVMDAEQMVDAALAGLDQGELVTIPALPDAREWDSLNAARQALRPRLSLSQAAERYRAATVAA